MNVYDVMIIRAEGAFAGINKTIASCCKAPIIIDSYERFRPIWSCRTGRYPIATDFKVYIHYNKKDTAEVNAWRNIHDRKFRRKAV